MLLGFALVIVGLALCALFPLISGYGYYLSRNGSVVMPWFMKLLGLASMITGVYPFLFRGLCLLFRCSTGDKNGNWKTWLAVGAAGLMALIGGFVAFLVSTRHALHFLVLHGVDPKIPINDFGWILDLVLGGKGPLGLALLVGGYSLVAGAVYEIGNLVGILAKRIRR